MPFPPLWVWGQQVSCVEADAGQNVTSSSTVVASLEAARDNKAPIILQTSQGGAAYFAGKVSLNLIVRTAVRG